MIQLSEEEFYFIKIRVQVFFPFWHVPYMAYNDSADNKLNDNENYSNIVQFFLEFDLWNKLWVSESIYNHFKDSGIKWQSQLYIIKEYNF